MISCGILGGKYIRRAHTILGAVIWVSGTEWLGLSISHRPSTVAIYVPLMEQEYNQNELCTFVYSYAHTQTFEGNFLVSMTLVV